MTIDELCERNMNLVPYMIYKMGLNKLRDDLLDIGYIGLVKGCKSYNGSVAESTYLCTCIKIEIAKYMRYLKRGKRDINIPIVSLNTNVSETTELWELLDDGTNFVNDIIADDLYECLCKTIHEVVIEDNSNKKDRNESMYHMWLTGKGYTELSKEFNITKQRCQQILERLNLKVANKMKNFV